MYPSGGKVRPPYPLAKMLRVHLMQNWFGLSDPAMDEAVSMVASMRQFARLGHTGAVKRMQRRDLRWEIAAKRRGIKAMPVVPGDQA